MTPMGGRQAGFTLIELLLVIVVVGILARIAIPNYQALTYKARAVDVMADIEVIEQAARSYASDRITWPAESATGVVPSGLQDYLPEGFGFAGEDFTLDWENVSIPGGLPDDPDTSEIVGVAVVTDHERLANALAEVFGETGWYVVGNSYTRIVERR